MTVDYDEDYDEEEYDDEEYEEDYDDDEEYDHDHDDEYCPECEEDEETYEPEEEFSEDEEYPEAEEEVIYPELLTDISGPIGVVTIMPTGETVVDIELDFSDIPGVSSYEVRITPL